MAIYVFKVLAYFPEVLCSRVRHTMLQVRPLHDELVRNGIKYTARERERLDAAERLDEDDDWRGNKLPSA